MTFAILLTFVSALAINWAWIREHSAAASLPALSVRRPRESLTILFQSRRWLAGFVAESGGFLCYVGALTLAPLALVQSLSAGGLGILAFLSSRLARMRLTRREEIGVAVSVVGLAMLGISLAGATGNGDAGKWYGVVVWVVASAGIAAAAIAFGRRPLGAAAAHGLAAGVLFAAGDVLTKTIVSGGARMLFIPAMIAAYSIGTIVLQLGFQRGGALATAGMTTLFTNALPIIAGTTLYSEQFPDGELGFLRGIAFTLLIAGAVLLSRPEPDGEETIVELKLAGAR